MKVSTATLSYVLITPARNEERFISQTIDSVAAQTIKPLRWVIVNDGSTDRTKEIVQSRARAHEFITLVNLERVGQRDFARKAHAFAKGLSVIGDLDYRFIGNLDADISLQPDYYGAILGKFAEDPALGIAGGIVYTKIGERFLTSDATTHSVGGAVQLFRRDCFQAIGGYMPLPHGGIDAAAEIKARMLGWKVRKFLDYKVMEQRRTGSASGTPIAARIREGRRFHSLGYGLLFYLARSAYRLKDPPAVIGSLAAIYGYLNSYLKREPVQLPGDMVDFIRHEQLERLKTLCRRRSDELDMFLGESFDRPRR